jgi:uncharacterized protein (DUF1501 family)
MRTTRRQFIKTSAGAVTLSLMMPKVLLGQSPINPNRRIFVIIQLNGANDGLNTVIPYSNSRYVSLRPSLHFKADEMVNNGVSTVIDGELGFHPSLVELKGFWDAGKVAAVLGIGYPSANLSHFSSTDIWMSGDPTQKNLHRLDWPICRFGIGGKIRLIDYRFRQLATKGDVRQQSGGAEHCPFKQCQQPLLELHLSDRRAFYR